jgi:hypothetical protein
MNDIDFYTSKSNTLPAKRMSVDYALRLIKEGKYREYADKVRNAKTREEIDWAKFDAPGFSFSGIFERRGKKRLIRHSGIMAIDIDHLDGDVLSEKGRLMKNPYVYSVFLSISGKGLKVLVKVPDGLDAERHKLYYRAIAEDFGVDEDRRAQDIARYTNITYDPDLYLNLGALVWDKPVEAKEEMTINPDTANYTIPITDMDERLRIILSWTEGGFRRGNRNGYVYDTACNLCEYGIGRDEALDILLPYASPDFTTDEIRYAVGNAYRNKRFGSKTLRREGADERLKALFSRVKSAGSVPFHHLPNPTMEYRPDMRIVIVDDDDVAEGMTVFFPGFQWFSTGGKVLSEELMAGIPRHLRILICPRLNNQWSYEWKTEIEALQWKGYNLHVWKWWKEFEPGVDDCTKGSSVYDVICRR